MRLQRSCHEDRVSPGGESCLSTLKLTDISLIRRKRVLLRSNRAKCRNWGYMAAAVADKHWADCKGEAAATLDRFSEAADRAAISFERIMLPIEFVRYRRSIWPYRATLRSLRCRLT